MTGSKLFIAIQGLLRLGFIGYDELFGLAGPPPFRLLLRLNDSDIHRHRNDETSPNDYPRVLSSPSEAKVMLFSPSVKLFDCGVLS